MPLNRISIGSKPPCLYLPYTASTPKEGEKGFFSFAVADAAILSRDFNSSARRSERRREEDFKLTCQSGVSDEEEEEEEIEMEGGKEDLEAGMDLNVD